MRKHTPFGWSELLTGILFVLLGIFTFIRPGSAITGLVFLYGILATLTGIADIVFYAKMENHMGFGPTISLVSGILSLLAGLMLLLHPGAGAWAMALLFPLWFITHCISRLTHLPIIRITSGTGYYYFSLIVNILGLVLGFYMILDPVFSFFSAAYIIEFYLMLTGIDHLVLGTSNIGMRR